MARISLGPLGRNPVSSRVYLLVAIVLMSFPLPALAVDAAAEVASRIAAGEFGPALAIAAAVNDPALRDKLLGNIAIAQARAGGRAAALDTASDISNDLARKAALGSMAAGNSPAVR